MTVAGKPSWLKVSPAWSPEARRMDALLREEGLHTVCKEANCPNRGGCWQEGSAAFLILGPVCTRGCGFCNVTSGRPLPVDPAEPQRLAKTAQRLHLRHVVITSVTRDDLADGGAGQFASCLYALRQALPQATLEVLVPDFRHKPQALATVLQAAPTIFNHNVETVPRLYERVRPGASFAHSLELLQQASLQGKVPTKSGLMLGLGEEWQEVIEVMQRLREAGVSLLTIGQYLQPSREHLAVERFWTPDEFNQLGEYGRQLGFLRVDSHPLARSSYHAAEAVLALAS
ncbi:MAG: lipoyl synthase [Magnetococcales bacterium]|nr:lipoyl synthase [Magnetococcales bacterium]